MLLQKIKHTLLMFTVQCETLKSINPITNGSNVIVLSAIQKLGTVSVSDWSLMNWIWLRHKRPQYFGFLILFFCTLVSLKRCSHNIKATTLLVMGNTNSLGVSHGGGLSQVSELGSTLLAYLWSISLPVVWIWWRPALQSSPVRLYCMCM